MKGACCVLLLMMFAGPLVRCQSIAYSPVFDVNTRFYAYICRHNGQLVTFNMQTTGLNEYESSLYLYDDEMRLQQQLLLGVPKQIFSVQFVAYSNFFYMFYQHQHGDTVSLEAAKINMQGQLLDSIKYLDETIATYYPRSENKIYSVVASENKKYITAFKISSPAARTSVLTTLLYDGELQFKHKSQLFIAINNGQDFFTEFNVDNSGALVFLRKSDAGDNTEAARRTVMVIKNAFSDSVVVANVIPPDISINDAHVKIDNLHSRYLVFSFYSTNQYRNIDGLYCFAWNAATRGTAYAKKLVFEDSLRRAANQPGPLKTALNFFNIQGIVLRNDGGCIIDAGSYTFYPVINNYSPWNQLFYFTNYLPNGYISYQLNSHYPWNAWSSLPPSVYSFAGGNILACSLDSSMAPEWVKFVETSTFNNEYNYIGYTSAALGNSVFYIYNQTEKRTSFLSSQSIAPDGAATGLMFRDIDKTIQYKIHFVPRTGIKISNSEVLMVCKIGGKTCYAKIGFNQ